MLKLLHLVFWYLLLHLVAVVALLGGLVLWRAIKARRQESMLRLGP